jgi:hypothetical protein
MLGMTQPVVSDARSADLLAEIRMYYLQSVQSEAAIEPALVAIDAARVAPGVEPGSELDAVLAAYGGAVVTLRAKHAFWPPTRMRHLRDGLAILDALVEKHPDQAEIRYLRLMSCYYLPGILGRNWSVRDDFAALADLLPRVERSYPPELHETITKFVLHNAHLTADQRARLEHGILGDDE